MGQPLAYARGTVPVRRLLQRSCAASAQVGNWKTNFDFSNLPGITRLLFNTSSVSVRRKNAPTSNISGVAGKPKGTPAADRRALMNSELGVGFGAAMLIGPSNSSCFISQ